MAAPQQLTVDDVYQFILENGGKVSNRELVKHFKKYLTGPDRPDDAHQKFTEIVNTVATVKPENNVKYLILKKDFKQKKLSASVTPSSDVALSDGLTHSASFPNQTHSNTNELDTKICDTNVPFQNVPVSSKFSSASGPWSPDLPPGHTPQPPPRRKSSGRGKENRMSKPNEAGRLCEGKNMEETRGSRHQEDITEVVSPGSVKERAQKLNKMASEVDLSHKGINGNSNRRRDHKHEKGGDDDDTCSVTTLDPRRKEWIVSASQADYHSLVKMLKEEPKLASCKDLNSYNALHWAAKHGNLDIIKLIAGTYKINSNFKTSGGYTALHLAAMFGREEIMEILINTYGADPSVRDFSGKRPVQYLPKDHAERKRYFSTVSYEHPTTPVRTLDSGLERSPHISIRSPFRSLRMTQSSVKYEPPKTFLSNTLPKNFFY